MNIGVPKEIKQQEYRVALLPSAAYQLIKRGHTRRRRDKTPARAPAIPTRITPKPARRWSTITRPFSNRADLIVKVKEPLPAEYPLLRPGQILFTYLHLAANRR